LPRLARGLLVAAAKNKFDTNNRQVEQFAASLMLLNRALVNYGSEADDTKVLLRKYTIAKIAETWPGGPGPNPEPAIPGLEVAWQAQEATGVCELTAIADRVLSRRNPLVYLHKPRAPLGRSCCWSCF
jgi:hypothetical protein